MADADSTSSPQEEAVQPPAPSAEAASAAPAPQAAPSEPLATPKAEGQTAQIPADEPIASEPVPIDTATQAPAAESQPSDGAQDKPAETVQEQSPTEATVSKESKPAPSSAPAERLAPAPAAPAPVVASANPARLARDLLVKARATIQQRKQKKLEKIVEYISAKGKISNDQVEKLLHVSDATATRYLSALEKQGRIKQVGKTGKAVTYTRI